MKQVSLPASHYAALWPTNLLKKTTVITALGCEYALLPEGSEKEEKLNEILQSFHGYLLKYMSMILQGHLPFAKNGGGSVNADTLSLLRCFIPSGAPLNRVTLGQACRTLHLAFRGMLAAEVYDQLMLCMVKTVRRYDPTYTDKVKEVAGLIERELHDKIKFTATECNLHLDYDGSRYLKLLVKREFLSTHSAEAGCETRFSRSATWPPPQTFFTSGAVGLPYFVSKWFRFFLVDWIHWRMSELESKEGILQLEQRSVYCRPGSNSNSLTNSSTQHLQGEFTMARSGKSISADMSMLSMPIDIGEMNLDWVQGKSSGLFQKLTRRDRHFLYCIFARDMSWSDIAYTFEMPMRDVRLWYDELLTSLSTRTLPLVSTAGQN